MATKAIRMTDEELMERIIAALQRAKKEVVKDPEITTAEVSMVDLIRLVKDELLEDFDVRVIDVELDEIERVIHQMAETASPDDCPRISIRKCVVISNYI